MVIVAISGCEKDPTDMETPIEDLQRGDEYQGGFVVINVQDGLAVKDEQGGLTKGDPFIAIVNKVDLGPYYVDEMLAAAKSFREGGYNDWFIPGALHQINWMMALKFLPDGNSAYGLTELKWYWFLNGDSPSIRLCPPSIYSTEWTSNLGSDPHPLRMMRIIYY